MIERTAKVAQEYAGRYIKVGETFEVEPQHVTLLLTIGRIEPEEGEPGYVSRDMAADHGGSYLTREIKRGRPRKVQ